MLDEQPGGEPERTKSQQQEFSSFGIERVIPLRIVQATNNCHIPPEIEYPGVQPDPNWATCSPCTDDPDPVNNPNCGPDTVSFEDIRNAVEKANFALRAVGVQVYVSRIEKYAMPTFYTTCNPSDECFEKYWNAVKQDLQKVYPSYVDTTPHKWAEISWISRAKLLAGDPSQIDVIVPYYSNGAEGRRPWEGPASLTADSWLFKRPRVLAHEIGHIIGLEHTMAPEQFNVRDPTEPGDLDVAPLSEYWDLSFGAAAPDYTPVFFSSRLEAEQYAGSLYTKHNSWAWPHNCTVDTNCTLSCEIGLYYATKVHVTTGDVGANGLAFKFAQDRPWWGIYRRGFNAMMYMDNPYPDGRPFCERSSFSDSQAEQVKKILRSDIALNAGWLGFQPGDGYTSQRYALGNIKTTTGFDQMDFDGDGKRDIAIWQPAALPYFFVRTSSSGYTTSIQRYLGLAGDVPVPADYDGDGITDFAVIRRGGLTASDPYDSQLQWIWCSSQNNHDCGSNNEGFDSLGWGWQSDVPLPGLDFDGNPSTGEIAVYRPTTGYIFWRTVDNSGGGAIYTGFSGNPNLTFLHGLYDTDNKTDLVAYDPDVGSFTILLSTQNWSTALKIVRYVDPALIPSGAAPSSPAERFGGVPLVAEKYGRRVLRIWDPYTGTWYTNWNPLNSGTFQSCTMGTKGDVPLSGPIDTDLNGHTDFALFRATGLFSPLVWVRQPNSNSCNLGGSVTMLGDSRRLNGSVVRDMDSTDGRGELLVLDTDKSLWKRYVSQPNGSFTEQSGLTIGTNDSLAL